jgi:tetratricopeptide (TPR) repeat protein
VKRRLKYRLELVCGLALVLCAVLQIPACAESAATAFDTANKVYEQGKFNEAAAAYESMLRSGEASAALYYNLGNAFFKEGQMGRAIAAYRHAEQLNPRDPDLRANLQFARNQIQGPTLASAWWQRWLGRLSLNEWTYLAVAAIWLLLLLLTLLQWRPTWKQQLKAYAIAVAAATVLLCVCFAGALYQDRYSPQAIVVTREATVRQGPLDEAPTTFTVRDGSELKVLDRKDEWLQVTADSRRSGWVRRDQVLVTPGA